MTDRDLKNKTILVTGASGFIGRNLIDRLSVTGAKLIAVIPSSEQVSLPVETIPYDGSFESLLGPLSGRHVDFIVHLATLFLSNHKPEQISPLIDANVKFGNHLLELARQLKIPYFINTSTYFVFSTHEGYNPQNLYAATKYSFEAIMKYYEEVTGTIFVTLELTDNYGPGDSRPKFINLVIDAVRKNEVFRMSPGEQEICYLFVDDTVNAFITCMELLASGEISENSHFSVYADEVLRLKDLVALVADQMQVSLKTEAGFYPYRDREIMTYQPTFPRLPHWEPKVSLKEGIARIIAGNQNK
jgi:nucleoside-diphosphate-sugar epimerase